MEFLNPVTKEELKPACLQFKHKGWIVSVSHAFKFPEVVVWEEKQGGNEYTFIKRVDTVAQAIYYIDSKQL